MVEWHDVIFVYVRTNFAQTHMSDQDIKYLSQWYDTSVCIYIYLQFFAVKTFMLLLDLTKINDAE